MTKSLDELSGNFLRAEMIRNVVRQKSELGEPLTMANVGLEIQNLTNDTFGEIADDELAAAVAELADLPPDPAMFAGELEAEAAPIDGPLGSVDPVEPDAMPKAEALASEAPTMSLDELNEAIKQNTNALVVARHIVLDRQRDARVAKSAATNAHIAFERGGVPVSRDQLVRDFLASEAAIRAARAERNRGSAPGPSAHDLGRAGHGSSINRRYAPTRRGLLPGQRAYSLADSQRISGGYKIDTSGATPIPPVIKR